MPRLVSKKTPIYPELGADATREMVAAGLNKTTWYEASRVARQTIKDFTNGMIAPGPDVLFRLAVVLRADRDPHRAQLIVERWQRLKDLRKVPAGVLGGGAHAPSFLAGAGGREYLIAASTTGDRQTSLGGGREAPGVEGLDEPMPRWFRPYAEKIARLERRVEAGNDPADSDTTPPWLVRRQAA